MRQSAQRVDPSPSWKQEVNRRVAEHKERKGQAVCALDAPAENQPADSLAAKAAARVAARYAKAPSYSEMLAQEARGAVRAAESASRAALEAQAAAESVLAGLEAAAAPSAPEPDPRQARTRAVEPVRGAAAAAQPSNASAQRVSFEIRWDADLPVRESELAGARASRGNSDFAIPAENSWQQGQDVCDVLDGQAFEVVEAAQPIHANLIEFPRELVATRKLRPRRAEGPFADSVEATDSAEAQLSIFEAELSTLSTEPGAAGAAGAGTHTWVGPEWSGIELDEEPRQEVATPARASATVEKTESAQAWAAAPMEPAPMNQRVLAAVVDFSLTMAAFLAAGLVASINARVLPSVKDIGLGSALALPLIGVLYQAFFFALARATPGMKYARLELCTFAGKRPTLAQMCSRVGAFLLSLLPMGLGVVWAFFDEPQLSWHDRLSGTYLRQG